MHPLLLQVAIGDYAQWGIAGAIVLLVIVFLGFVLRSLPTWKEVRLAEINVREKEAEARAAQASSFGQLSEVLNNIAIHQRNETEGIRIMQRVNADTSERTEEIVGQLVEAVDRIGARLDSLEKRLPPLRKDNAAKPKESATD